MLLIDMQMPEHCEECPCSYWIQQGPNREKLMCNVMDSNKKENCLVESKGRPADCPILMEIR